MKIISDFDCGSIIERQYDNDGLHVSLSTTSTGETNHWFYFGILESPPSLTIIFDNAKSSRFAKGWYGYHPFISYDNLSWKRCELPFIINNDSTISLNLRNLPSTFYLSWYPPYPISRFHDNIKENDFIFQLGNSERQSILITVRQHPGETMGSYFLEGLMKYLYSHESTQLLSNYNFIIVPFVNIQGIEEGMHRTSFDGIDYNFNWFNNQIPRINLIKNYIREKQLIAYFDIHGDEISKNNYIYYTSKFKSVNTQFLKSLSTLNSVLLLERNKLKYIIRVLLRKHRIILGIRNTVEYIEKFKKCPGYVYELSAHKSTPEECIRQGENFGIVLNSFFNKP